MIKNKAFTLVELIVVITILAILGTIAFVSFQSYSSMSRDSVRVSDMNNIEKAMELSIIKGSPLPTPNNSIEISNSGSTLLYQGTLGENSLNIIGINNGGKDPLDLKEYIYTINEDRNKFQIMGFTEENLNDSNIENSYGRYPLIRGHNLGILLSESTLEPINVLSNNIDLDSGSEEYSIISYDDELVTGTGGIILDEIDNVVNPKGSCFNILKNGNSNGDGVYELNIDGNNLNVYCDMTTDGGGWSLFYANNGSNASPIKEHYKQMRDQVFANTKTYDLTDYNNEYLAGIINYKPFINNGAKEVLITNRNFKDERWGIFEFSSSSALEYALGPDMLDNSITPTCKILPNGATWSIRNKTNGINYTGLTHIFNHGGDGWGISDTVGCNGMGAEVLKHSAFYTADRNENIYRTRSDIIVGGSWGGDNQYRYFIR